MLSYTNCMNRALSLALILVAAGAEASFDLMYIPSASTNKVLRYDPVNRISLGSMAVNAPSSVNYRGGQYGRMTTGAGTYAYDMISGANAGYSPINITSVSDSGSEFYSVGASYSYHYSALGALIGGGNLGTYSVFTGTRLSNGNTVAFQISGSTINALMFNSAGVFVNSTNLNSSIAAIQMSTVIRTVDRFGVTWVRTVARDSAGNSRLVSVALSSGQGSVAGGSLSPVSQFSTSHAISIANAHSGFYLIGSDSTSPTTTTRFTAYDNDGAGVNYDTWTEAFDTRNVSNNYSVGIVLAPEPSVTATLALGLGALLARKRKR